MISHPYQLVDGTTVTDGTGLSLDAVTPAYALLAGGESVIITGTGFDSSAQVSFGDTPADIISVTPDQLKVAVPPAVIAGPVDLHVYTDAADATLSPGLWYFEDATGETGVIGFLKYNEIVGGYWSSTTDAWLSASITWTKDSSLTWWMIQAPGIEQCAADFSYSGATFVDLGSQGLSQLVLGDGDTNVTVPWSDNSVNFSLIGDPADFPFDASMDLAEIAPTGLPAFAVADIVRTPTSDFRVTSPAIESNTVPTITANPTIRWSGGDGDLVYIQISQLNASGSAYSQIVSCVATNDGSFTVPDLWDNWVMSRQIDVELTMARSSGGVLPTNHASSEIIGAWRKYGAAFAL
ncbi:MAG: hypothetical protein GXP62_14720 [Oligoflexia bacterium]|nr:hypothetical protein [Oligoflexia bacterium]